MLLLETERTSKYQGNSVSHCMAVQVPSSSGSLRDCHLGLSSWWLELRQRISGNKRPVSKPCWSLRSTLKTTYEFCLHKLLFIKWAGRNCLLCFFQNIQATLMVLRPQANSFFLSQIHKHTQKPHALQDGKCVSGGMKMGSACPSVGWRNGGSALGRALLVKDQECWPASVSSVSLREKWSWRD